MQAHKSEQGQKSHISELKSRLLFVLFALIVFRVGAHIPLPGVDSMKVAALFKTGTGGAVKFFNAFTGGALKQMSIFALSLMPYISSSIIIQLLSMTLPRLEQLKKEGGSGRRKLNQYTRVLTIILSSVQSLAISSYLISNNSVLISPTSFTMLTALSLATGTLFLMWLGEQISERGIGNGISLLIFAGIVSRFPVDISQLFMNAKNGNGIGSFGIMLLFVFSILLILFVVFIERGIRKITINYPKRFQGRQLMGGGSSHLPLKINMAGVIPAIFATAIILVPLQIVNFFPKSADVLHLLQPGRPLYFVFTAAAIAFFCFFYTSMVFSPKEMADNLKKSGALVPGIRPGQQTAAHIDTIMTRLTLVAAFYLTFIVLIPSVLRGQNISFSFGGTSLLISVVVVMDFISQIQAHMLPSKYGSLMKKSSKNQMSLLR